MIMTPKPSGPSSTKPVWFITGCSTGFGRELARQLLDLGYHVVVTARKTDAVKDLGEWANALVLKLDVTDQAQIKDAIKMAEKKFGHIDVLVNNAGISYTVGIEQETLEEFEHSMQVNTTAVWHLTKLCAPGMIERGAGSIINVASMLGHVGSAPIKQANYCASEGAVVNMTRELALQLARKGVRVNALCPGYFPSEMTEPMLGDDASQQYIRTYSGIPRMGEDHELDGALLLLASSAGSFITGQSVIVDGGWTAR